MARLLPARVWRCWSATALLKGLASTWSMGGARDDEASRSWTGRRKWLINAGFHCSCGDSEGEIETCLARLSERAWQSICCDGGLMAIPIPAILSVATNDHMLRTNTSPACYCCAKPWRTPPDLAHSKNPPGTAAAELDELLKTPESRSSIG